MTEDQRRAIQAFVHSAIVPLIEDVIVKKLGQAAIVLRDELTTPAQPKASEPLCRAKMVGWWNCECAVCIKRRDEPANHPKASEGKAGGEVTDAMVDILFRVLDDPHNQWHTRKERGRAAIAAAISALGDYPLASAFLQGRSALHRAVLTTASQHKSADYTDIANRVQENTGRGIYPSTVKAVLETAGISNTHLNETPMYTEIKFMRSHPNAQTPRKGTPGAAAFDLVSADVKLEGNIYVVNTGLRTAFPEGYVMLVFARSGLARRLGLHLINGVGVIDSDYRGDIQLMMRSSEMDVSTHEILQALAPGSRVAQAMIVPLPLVNWTEVEALDESIRGEGGFGSTGVR